MIRPRAGVRVPGGWYGAFLMVLAIASYSALVLACGRGDRRQAGPPGLAGVPEAQREILSDGVVTEAEYERAVLATLQCLDELGIVHSEPVWVEDLDKRTLWYSVTHPDGAADASAFDRCHQEFQREVDIQWVNQHAPSEDERQRRVAVALSCMRERGHPLTDVSEIRDYVENAGDAAREAWISCQGIAFQGFDPSAPGATAPPAATAAGPAPQQLVEFVPALETRWSTLSSYQRERLSDGEITRGEYEESAEALVICYRAIPGVLDAGLGPDPTGKFVSTNVILDTNVGSPAQLLDCESQFHDMIKATYEAVHGPSKAELVAAEAAVRSCLRELVDAEPGTAAYYEELSNADMPLAEAVADCSLDYAREHGVLWQPPSASDVAATATADAGG